MIDIEKEFPGVKALNKANLLLKKGSVHSLMGENGAGKSTLMKCLFGIYIEDAGIIKIDGKEVRFSSPKEAMDNGVAMVHQELNQVLRRNVMENMWLGRFPIKNGLVDHKKMYEKTKEIFEDLNIKVDPKAIIGKLSVSERQMVEIAKAVSYDAKIMVLDEPTSSLTEQEVELLFEIINRLRKKGVGMVYISHKMEEILEISDDVTIMRDGEWIATKSAKDLTTEEIIKLMVGRDLTDRFPINDAKIGDVLLQVKNLTGKYSPNLKDVSFELKKGEILGISGLVGSRRTELLETIFGIATKSSGELYIRGKKIENKNARDAINNKFALVTEERRATGIIPLKSITFNAVMSNIKSYISYGLLSNKKMEKDAKWVIESMKVKTPSSKTYIKTLSGGNQQKVIIGRWLLTDPDILLLDEPTRGIDVGAKYEIYQLIIDLAKNGKGVIVVSSEMPELLGICDRIMVMSNGKKAGEVLNDRSFSKEIQEELMRLAAKHV